MAIISRTETYKYYTQEGANRLMDSLVGNPQAILSSYTQSTEQNDYSIMANPVNIYTVEITRKINTEDTRFSVSV